MTPNKKIKLADIECVDNRKISGIEELAENIKAVGLLQPILIRAAEPNAVPPYVVVDGRRRFRALELLKRGFIEPEEYVFFTGEDELTSVAAFSANFSRQNLTLAEEVEALRNITDTTEGVAKMLGKTPAWVALRRNLANLSGEWFEVLNHPEQYPQWTAAKLELIAREPEEVQQRLDYLTEDAVSMQELRATIDGEHMVLADAPFDTAECCATCPNSSGAGNLFPEFGDGEVRCLDKKCFVHKAVEFVKAVLANTPLIPISGDRADYSAEDYQFAGKIRARSRYDFEMVRELAGDEEPNAIYVSGVNIGQLAVAVPRKDAAVTPARKTVTDDGVKVAEKTVAEREAELKAKRTKLALQKLLERLAKKEDTCLDLMKRGKYDVTKLRTACLKLAMYYGLNGDRRDWETDWRKPEWRDPIDFDIRVFDHARECWRQILSVETAKTLDKITDKAGQGICGLLFLDWGEFMKAAEAEIPEPKSLVAARIKEQQQANKKAKAAK